MRNTSKIISYLFLALSIVGTSCSPPTQEQLERDKLINEVKDKTLNIPAISSGGISGTISYITNNNTVLSNRDVRIKIIRQNDIPKLNAQGKPVDTAGKEFTDPTKQTQAFLEKKNDVLKNEILKNKDSYLVSGLRPGDVQIVLTAGSDESQSLAKIEVGKITQIPEIVIGKASTSSSPLTKIGINIKGRVLKPDGTPVANAKVSDVTQNAVSSSTTTNAQGEFSLQVNSFNKPKNLEASFNNSITSITVTPEQVEDIIIPLLTNARTVKGKLIDFVNKKPIANIPIKSVDSSSSTSTNENGEFTLRGVPTTITTLEIGPKIGYIDKQEVIQASDQETLLPKDIEITPKGNLVVTLTPDNYPDPIEILGVDPPGNTQRNAVTLTANPPVNLVHCPGPGGTAVDYVSNSIVFNVPLTGTIQIEGTNIIKEFTIPPTPIVEPKPECTVALDKTRAITVFLNNYEISVPFNDLPGGEYTISITAPFHETQKGIKVVVPSNDTITTELIQLRSVNRVLAIGDVVGNIIIRDVAGAEVNTTARLKVVALKGEVDLRSNTILNSIFTDANSPYVSSSTTLDISGASKAQYTLRNVPTGTRTIVAGIISSDGTLDTNYLISSYVSLNVVGNVLNKAPDGSLIKR